MFPSPQPRCTPPTNSESLKTKQDRNTPPQVHLTGPTLAEVVQARNMAGSVGHVDDPREVHGQEFLRQSGRGELCDLPFAMVRA